MCTRGGVILCTKVERGERGASQLHVLRLDGTMDLVEISFSMLAQHYVLLTLLIPLHSNLLTNDNTLSNKWLAEDCIIELNNRLFTMLVRPVLHHCLIQYSLPHPKYRQTHPRVRHNQYHLYSLCQHSILASVHSSSHCKPGQSSVRWPWTHQQKPVLPWLSHPISFSLVRLAKTSFLLLFYYQLATHHPQIEFIHTYFIVQIVLSIHMSLIRYMISRPESNITFIYKLWMFSSFAYFILHLCTFAFQCLQLHPVKLAPSSYHSLTSQANLEQTTDCSTHSLTSGHMTLHLHTLHTYQTNQYLLIPIIRKIGITSCIAPQYNSIFFFVVT